MHMHVNIAALTSLRNAMMAFRDGTAGLSDRVRLRIEQIERRISQRLRQLESEIRGLEKRLAGEDDQDGGDSALECALAEAYRELDRLQGCGQRLATAAQAYEAAAARWDSTLNSLVPDASAFLLRTCEAAADVHRLSAPDSVGHLGSGTSVAGGQLSSEAWTGHLDPMRATSPSELPALPAGFSWIPVDGLFGDLPRNDEFRKGATYDDMRAGFERLRGELIPLLAKSPGAGRSACEAFDRANGRVDPLGFAHPASLAELWSHFFGREPIRIEHGAEGTAHVVNGRHRLRIAHDLGWKFVPGQLVTRGPR
jgi:hypothetical protein